MTPMRAGSVNLEPQTKDRPALLDLHLVGDQWGRSGGSEKLPKPRKFSDYLFRQYRAH